MTALLEFIPLIAFLIAYYWGGFFTATAILMAATALCMGVLLCIKKKLSKMQWISLILILGLGAITLYFQDQRFVQWKVSIINAGFGIAFLVSDRFFNKPLLAQMMGSQLRLADPVWRKLNGFWVIFFFAIALLNLLVMYVFSETIWVYFKTFGVIGLTLVFMVLQGIYISRHIIEEDTPPSA